MSRAEQSPKGESERESRTANVTDCEAQAKVSAVVKPRLSEISKKSEKNADTIIIYVVVVFLLSLEKEFPRKICSVPCFRGGIKVKVFSDKERREAEGLTCPHTGNLGGTLLWGMSLTQNEIGKKQ